MKKVLSCVLLTTLVVSLVISGCAQPAEEEYITIITVPEGQSAYFGMLTLKDLLAKHSDWLRATVKAVAVNNTAELAKKPDIRSNTMVITIVWDSVKARRAMPPYTEPYTTERAVLLWGELASGLVTLDSKIKTLEDLQGKKVGTLAKGSAAETAIRWVLEERGLKVDLHNMAPRALADGLRDGTLDVIEVACAIFDGKEWIKHSLLAEIMETKKWYGVSYNPGSLEKIRETKGWVGGIATIPVGSLPNQTADWRVHTLFPYLSADESLDDKFVTEVLRVVYENMDEYREAHIAIRGMSTQRMAYLPFSEELFHPAAVKFYKDKGIPIGF